MKPIVLDLSDDIFYPELLDTLSPTGLGLYYSNLLQLRALLERHDSVVLRIHDNLRTHITADFFHSLLKELTGYFSNPDYLDKSLRIEAHPDNIFLTQDVLNYLYKPTKPSLIRNKNNKRFIFMLITVILGVMVYFFIFMFLILYYLLPLITNYSRNSFSITVIVYCIIISLILYIISYAKTFMLTKKRHDHFGLSLFNKKHPNKSL